MESEFVAGRPMERGFVAGRLMEREFVAGRPTVVGSHLH